jgi:hypothetical protein
MVSSGNIWHAVHLITWKKAENAVQFIKRLSNMINQPLHCEADASSEATLSKQKGKIGLEGH